MTSSVFFCDLRQLIERRATRAEFRAFVDGAERKVKDAVEAEREACARTMERVARETAVRGSHFGSDIKARDEKVAAAIRARGEGT